MATNSIALNANVNGSVYTSNLNDALEALDTLHSGTSAPTTQLVNGKLWLDTTTNTLYVYQGSSWVNFSTIQSDLSTVATSGSYADLSNKPVIEPGGIEYSEKSSNYTAVAKEGIVANTGSSSWILTLPASPSSGDVVVLVDGADWGVNNLTVARNGSTIAGLSENLTLDIGNVSVTLIYAFNTWQVYTQMGAVGGSVVTEAGIQTLTNKTINSSQLTGSLPALDGSNLTNMYNPVKAWANIDGTTGTIRASSGIASCVRNGTGTYTVTFTTGLMPDANYAMSGTAGYSGPDNRANIDIVQLTQTTAKFTVMNHGNGTVVDRTFVCVTFVR